MPTLHGSWLLATESCSFFLWGETWRSQVVPTEDNIPLHPYLVHQETLQEYLNHLNTSNNLDWQNQIISLPSKSEQLPLLSQQLTTTNHNLTLQPWCIQGFNLTITEALPWLASIPLTSLPQEQQEYGDDIRFWCHIYRWSLDLLARGKFIPHLTLATETTAQTHWRLLLDNSLDQARLVKFTRLMPLVCTQYQPNQSYSAQYLLLSVLSAIVDQQIRNYLDSPPLSAKASTLQKWLHTLSQPVKTKLTAPSQELKRIETSLNNWILPRQEYIVINPDYQLGENQFRLCLVLTPPTDIESDWQLQYNLQALDAPELLLDAATIWQNPVSELVYQGRTITQPQETLLKGLGLASRLYPPIASSLEAKQPHNCILSDIEVYQFIRGLAQELQNNGLGVILPDGLASDTHQRRLGVKISATLTEKSGQRLGLKSLLDYQLAITVGEQVISETEFKQLLAAQSPLVKVNDQWLALQPSDVQAAQAIFRQSQQPLNLSVEDGIRLSTGVEKVLAKLPVVKFEAQGILQELLDYINNNQALTIIPQPETFQGQLRSYQLRGVSWLAFLDRWGFGACLADDMGLGKTPQLLAFLLHLQSQQHLVKPSLVVCPTSVLNNWEREADKFAPTLKVLVHHGDKRYQGKEFSKKVAKFDLVVTSYSLLYRDLTTLQSVEWQIVALDEAQNIKNPSAKQSQAARQLKTDFRLALTGTPVENRLGELWSIIDFINPGWLGNRQFFQSRFAIPIEKHGDNQSLIALRSLISPFILRRLKTEPEISQDLPEKQEMNVFCGLSVEQAQLYQKLVDESLETIDELDGIQRRATILTLLLHLKQICNHPAHFLKAKSLDSSQRSGKLLRLEEMLDELIVSGDRALIFTQFSEWGKLLQAYLTHKFKTEVLFLYGATRRNQRQEMIDRFQNDPNAPSIFILSLKAGGTGLNLTRANHVFHIDRWWNPAVENQATDRAFRLGQTRNVQVHKFICTGTLEERIHEMIESKKQLAEQTITSGEDWLTELDTNQLRDLLLLDRDGIIDE